MPSHARLPLWDDKSDAQKLETLHSLVMDLYRYELADTHRQLLEMLNAHQTTDPKEIADIATIKRLIHEHPNIINMNCEVGHITASAIVVDMTSKRILLHFHKRLQRWLQVGGHADYERDFSLVALREAQEETGLPDLAHYPEQTSVVPIDYDIHTIPQSNDKPEHLHLDFRYILVTNQPDALSPADGESTRFKWLSFDDALSLGDDIDDALHRLIDKTCKLGVQSQSEMVRIG
jgi:8-oxo-dGTP pyrophosphatase MutT (NUDIX family)